MALVSSITTSLIIVFLFVICNEYQRTVSPTEKKKNGHIIKIIILLLY